jgi:cytochrome c oxidase subunit 2
MLALVQAALQSARHSVTAPASPQAHAVATLFWWLLGVGALVWFLVVAVGIYAAFARRGTPGEDGLMHVSPATHARMERMVIGAGIVTAAILLGFLVFDFSVGRALASFPAQSITIDVTGHQWWWQVQYEDPNPSLWVTTANEIHVPVGEAVQFKLASSDVIHSFWVPNMDGKRDLIPGYRSSIWFRADTPGVYRGQCAEFCGMQHAHMAFLVIAEPRPQFTTWLLRQRTSAPPPADSLAAAGLNIFLSGQCALCHTVGGTAAHGTVGPDLTHFASRRELGAGTAPNTRGYLGGWVVNAQALKPGSRMPPNHLEPGQLQALLAYLETLK